LLSGGIDSAIIAAFAPRGTKAFTIRFISEGFIDESGQAKKYCDAYGLEHRTIDVFWEDYTRYSPFLMKNKNAPLHPIEVALYKAALEARGQGVEVLVVGNGADSTFGGMDKLLSRDYTLDEFIARYTFIDPALVLEEPVTIRQVYEPYAANGMVDVQKFLKVVHGTGIIQSFENSIKSAGLSIRAPFEKVYLSKPLDLTRIRSGEPKYILRSLFKRLYPDFTIPDKIPFARPMESWLRSWKGPVRHEFRKEADYDNLSGDQRWLVYSLETFLDLIDPKNT
jgi:asparagine synthetase B (glutamine-hydrolysing)